MRVGLIIYGSLDALSGGFLYDRKLVECLRRSGDSVTIIALPNRGYLLNLITNLNRRWAQKIQDLRLDLLIEDELNHPSLFRLNRLIKNRTRLPLVAIVHHLRSSERHPGWLLPFYKSIEKGYLATIDTFVFNSQTTRASVENLVDGPVPGIVAHPAGDRFGALPDAAAIARRLEHAGPRRLLFLGNIIPRKGLHDLIAALAQCKRPDWQLTVAGSQLADQAYCRRVKHRIDRAGLAHRVDFLGKVSDGELRRLLETHDLLALPSQYEGFGIVYLEAMGFGLPAIACREGAAAEIINHRVNGVVVPSGDKVALTHELTRILGNPQYLLDMSLAARQRFPDFAGWDESMDRIRLFLKTTANQPEPG